MSASLSMAVRLSCIVVLVFCWSVTVSQCSLRIGAFNIQTFGQSKFGVENIMRYIDQIVRRYDIVLIQEIRDVQGVVIPGFLDRLRNYGEPWEVVFSERLGRTSYKEQYAYYYRADKVSVISTYQYDDGPDDGTDWFAREPFGALFASSQSSIAEFGIMGIHTDPDVAETELGLMTYVYEASRSHWNNPNILLLGDFNADCSYVTSSEWPLIGLRQIPDYLWLIGDHMDTTVSPNTHCAYDRIVAAGDDMIASINTTSAMEYRFDSEFNIKYRKAKEISDHYPVEVTIY